MSKDDIDEYCTDLENKIEEQAGALSAMKSALAAYQDENQRLSAEMSDKILWTFPSDPNDWRAEITKYREALEEIAYGESKSMPHGRIMCRAIAKTALVQDRQSHE